MLRALQVSTPALAGVYTVLRAGVVTVTAWTAGVTPVTAGGGVDSNDHDSDDSVTSLS